MKLLNNEIFFRGQPDKLADQISDKIVMEYLKRDPLSKVNVDVVGGEGMIFITGTIYSSIELNTKKITDNLLNELGYELNLEFIDNIEMRKTKEYKPENEDFVIYGYACNETTQLLPKTMVILQEFSKAYDNLCREDLSFLPDGKALLTCLYNDDNELLKIKAVNINYQNTGKNIEHTDEVIKDLFRNVADKYSIEVDTFIINSSGEFTKGGFDRDTGITGRRKDMDMYHGFSKTSESILCGKDPTALPRLAAFKARNMAKEILNKHKLKWCEVKIELLDGNVNFSVESNDDKIKIELDEKLNIKSIAESAIEDLDILNKNYVDLAAFGNFQ